MILKNYDVAELRRLDVAHHLAAQQDQGLMRDLGGARIITRADGSYIYDCEGNAILDGRVGLWFVQVGSGRKEITDAAYEQQPELPFYNTFFTTVTPPTIQQIEKATRVESG